MLDRWGTINNRKYGIQVRVPYSRLYKIFYCVKLSQGETIEIDNYYSLPMMLSVR